MSEKDGLGGSCWGRSKGWLVRALFEAFQVDKRQLEQHRVEHHQATITLVLLVNVAENDAENRGVGG